MLLSLRASTSRLPLPLTPYRAFTSFLRTDKPLLVPTPNYPTPEALLTKIGHNAERRLLPHTETWENLNEVWRNGSDIFKYAGFRPRDKLYVLWALDKYSQGIAPEEFGEMPKKPKKFRGWGPKIQHGVRVWG